MSDARNFVDDLKQVVLPLVVVERDATWHALGTSFVVAVSDRKKAFLLTAAHNLHHVRSLDGRGQVHHPTASPDFLPKPPEWTDLNGTDVFAVLVTPSGVVLAPMVRAWFQESFDIALVLVQIRDDDDAAFPARLALDTTPVDVNHEVFAVGYPGMVASSTADFETKDFRASLQIQLQARRGKVVALCPSGIGIHKWPGFLITSPLDSGMSGGPILDVGGPVPIARGIIGGDLSERPDHGQVGSGAQAFASLLWPATLTKTQVAIASEDGTPLVPNSARLIDLIRIGMVDDRGRAHEHVDFEELGDKLAYRWRA